MFADLLIEFFDSAVMQIDLARQTRGVLIMLGYDVFKILDSLI